MRIRSRTKLAAATIAEAVIAAGCLALFFGGLFALTSQSLLVLRSMGQQAAATFCLQQRVEEIRRMTWAQITDGAYIRDHVLVNAAGSNVSLPGMAEQITVNVYPTATTASVIDRPPGGPAALQLSNPALVSAAMVRVDALVSWPKRGGGTNSRQFSTVITNGGITR